MAEEASRAAIRGLYGQFAIETDLVLIHTRHPGDLPSIGVMRGEFGHQGLRSIRLAPIVESQTGQRTHEARSDADDLRRGMFSLQHYIESVDSDLFEGCGNADMDIAPHCVLCFSHFRGSIGSRRLIQSQVDLQ